MPAADLGVVRDHAPGLPKRHLVRLASIDEDALGEEIEVLWELEPGAHVIERAGLPRMTGLDDPSTLQAFLDAVVWGAATNADRGYLQAPFRSGVSIEDYQLDPLVRAIDMARTNLLIADDVGLGKTIEAGLVVQEMLLRHRARTVMVLCPASLQEKWRVEMQEKFGLEFRIVDTDYVKRLRRERGLHANPWTSFPRLITSMDWAKQGEGLRLLRDALPPHVSHPRKFDLLIIDEAHNVAPTVGRYAVESLRTRLVRLAAPHFQHKLFLTATPRRSRACRLSRTGRRPAGDGGDEPGASNRSYPAWAAAPPARRPVAPARIPVMAKVRHVGIVEGERRWTWAIKGKPSPNGATGR